MFGYPQFLSQLGSPTAWWQRGAEGHTPKKNGRSEGNSEEVLDGLPLIHVFWVKTPKSRNMKSKLFLIEVPHLYLWHMMVL